MRPETDLMQHVRGRLQEMAEPDYAEFSRRLLPSGVRRVYGVRVPQLRALARELVSAYDWDSVFRALLQPATFEEQMLCGLVLGYGCHDGRRWLETVDCFVGLIDNWSVCDSCCATFKIVQRHRELFWPYLLSQAHSPEQYRQRFALVVWLGQYRASAWREAVLDELAQMPLKNYYAQMAAAWLLSVWVLDLPEETLRVISEMKVPAEVGLMALQKMADSLRTPSEVRNRLSDMGKQLRAVKCQ